MKIKRHKHVRKTINFYSTYFGFNIPFKIVIDGTFCKEALSCQVNIAEQMPKYLDVEAKLCTTKCVKAECESLGSLLYGPFKILQQYEELPCRHTTAVPAGKCMRDMAKTKKYFMATQDSDLQDAIRRKAGVPLMYISYKAIILESPSEHSKKVAEHKVEQKVTPSEHEFSVIKQLKVQTFGEEPQKKKKKKKKGGPNPLSCKKKKTNTKDSKFMKDNVGSVKKKRKRTRIKMAAHVKEHLMQMKST